MQKINLKELLKRALGVGAVEVKLIPGRRTVVVTPKGENEVRGEAQSPESINAALQPLLTPEAKRALSSGWAEWEFDLDESGRVRATCELKMGLVHAVFYLDNCSDDEVSLAPPPRAPEPVSAPVRAAPVAAPSARRAPEVDEASLPDLDSEFPSGGARAPAPEPGLRTVPPLPHDYQATGVALSSGSSAQIDALLLAMLERKASDLHVSSANVPMLRIDGEMRPIPGQASLAPEALQRLLWPIVPPRNREEFQERHDTDFAYELAGKARFRANMFVDLRGVGAVFRVIPSKILSVDDLRLPRELLSLCQLTKGLVLVTGPTGSGKSTTLAALIDYINDTRHDHIITIEDPVEFVHPNKKCLINQRQVGEHTKSFKVALRAALREDPDIVLLGEMRDLETVSIALETAETGHLVFGTLHTSSAPATVDRIIDQFPSGEQNQIRQMLSGSLKGVISQTLCKKIGGGRVAALEVMFGIPAVANLIREGKIFQIPSIMQTGRNIGMRLMTDSLAQHVKDGLVTPEEAMLKAPDKAGLESAFRQFNIQYKKS
ncbi:MAG TPA: type IV pilus twitching motility protein PilT [Polyangiaceae bacterium]|nr:type IV pilus twitching motility protein PilT [Polyangiaceae bacterium]